MKPDRKVAAGGFAGAVTAVLVWVAAEFGQVTIPGEIAAAIATIISTAVAYFVPNPNPKPAP